MIVFISNFLNHHQKPVADRLYALTGGEYRFVEMTEMPDRFVKNGYPVYKEPWLIKYWKDDAAKQITINLIARADCVVWDGSSLHKYIRKRLRSGKITFEYGERWLKKGLLNFLSPRLIRNQIWYHFLMPKENFYRLNIGAYASGDYALMRSFTNKMFRWGYFPNVDISPNISAEKIDLSGKDNKDKLSIMWVGRFIGFKHPEMAVEVAAKLKEKGVNFELNMFGSGRLLGKTRKLAEKADVKKEVRFWGNLDNSALLNEMRKNDILLFTSDRREGWGAVVNEAMGCGCVVVANNDSGSVPWLIKSGENGIIVDADVELMAAKISEIWSDRAELKKMGERGKATVALNGLWGAESAAVAFMRLLKALETGEDAQIESGPGSHDKY